MNASPETWFEVLEVDSGDVARVGYSLAGYADEYEGFSGTRGASEEHVLMQATTLAEAGSLVVLVDSSAGRELFGRAAQILEVMGRPEMWTLGLAAQGVWRPSPVTHSRRDLTEPADAMAPLVALYADQEARRRPRNSAWRVASEFGYSEQLSWSSAGVPAATFSLLTGQAREGNLDAVMDLLDLITDRSDETIRFAQENDSWHWRRFSSDVPLVDPELLALGAVLSRVDGDIADRLQERHLTPARVAVLAGMSLRQWDSRDHPDGTR